MREDSGGKDGRFGLRLPSPAMAVALLALFVALGGSAWAVSKVGTGQIKDGAVTTPKIKASAVNGSRLAGGAVTAPKIAPGAVGTEALAEGSIIGSKLAPAAVGSEIILDGSVTGSKLADGAVGGSNVSVTTVSGTPVDLPTGGATTLNVNCPAGKKAISAGLSSNGVVWIWQQYVSAGTAFVSVANVPDSPPKQVIPRAVCL